MARPKRLPTEVRLDRGNKGRSKISELKDAHDASVHECGRSGRSVKQVVFTVFLYQLIQEFREEAVSFECQLHSCTVHTSQQALVTDAPTLSRWLMLCHKTEFHLSW